MRVFFWLLQFVCHANGVCVQLGLFTCRRHDGETGQVIVPIAGLLLEFRMCLQLVPLHGDAGISIHWIRCAGFPPSARASYPVGCNDAMVCCICSCATVARSSVLPFLECLRAAFWLQWRRERFPYGYALIAGQFPCALRAAATVPRRVCGG